MFGQLWQATVPTAQSFLRAVTSADQPGDFEHETACKKELPVVRRGSSVPPTITLTGHSSFDATSNKFQDLRQSDTTGPMAVTDQMLRDGALRNVGEDATNLNTPSDAVALPAWKQKIMDKNEANKKEISDIGDDFTYKAIERIAKMPEERRDKAAEEYVRSTDYIMKGVKRVMNFSANVSSYF